MRVLAIESSTILASVAVLENDKILSFASSTNQRSHSEFLNPAIEKCLQTSGINFNQIDVFACGLGPGSFTGVRVAGNIAKSFSYLFSKPMVAIDSLEILHHQNLSKGYQVVLINAYKNQVYTAFYVDGQRVLAPCALNLEKLEKAITEKFGSQESIEICGDGYFIFENEFSPQLRSRLSRSSEAKDYPSAETLGHLAYEKGQINQTKDWKSYAPLYIRDSEAEEKRREKDGY